MTGEGFIGGAYSSAWISAWFTIGILVLIIFFAYILLKNDLMPVPFSLGGASIGILLAIIIISFTSWTKLSFIIGLIGILIGGAVIGNMTES